jgi:hypothetical protein
MLYQIKTFVSLIYIKKIIYKSITHKAYFINNTALEYVLVWIACVAIMVFGDGGANAYFFARFFRYFQN